jgi:hypothetical protein
MQKVLLLYLQAIQVKNGTFIEVEMNSDKDASNLTPIQYCCSSKSQKQATG